MKAGDKLQVRAEGSRSWVNGNIELASENGKSMAITLEEETLGFGAFGVHALNGQIMILLLRENDRWIDIHSGAVCEIWEAGEIAPCD